MSLLGLLMIASAGRGQILGHDLSFPVLKHLRWDMSIEEVQKVGNSLGILVKSSDTSITLSSPVFGFAAQTNLLFKHDIREPALIQVQFPEPSEAVIDSLVGHFTRALGMAPNKFSQEKSALIFTIRFEFFQWKTTECTIVVQRIAKGTTLINTGVFFRRPALRAGDKPSSLPHQ